MYTCKGSLGRDTMQARQKNADIDSPDTFVRFRQSKHGAQIVYILFMSVSNFAFQVRTRLFSEMTLSNTLIYVRTKQPVFPTCSYEFT